MAETAEYTRRAVDNYRSKYDFVQIRLPKGTRERAKALGANVNNVAVDAVLARLDALERMEKTQEKPLDGNSDAFRYVAPPAEPKAEQTADDLAKFNKLIADKQAEREAYKRR